MPFMLWDIFCRVIDNYGDIGVCWRLSADLSDRGHSVRLWVDDPVALRWMAPGALEGSRSGVQVLPWEASKDAAFVSRLTPANAWIEAFGCEIAPEFIASCAHPVGASAEFSFEFPVWLNLEYLSAESFVERHHTLPSPVNHGPGKGATKYFFYPGFTEKTGGLLREPGIAARRLNFDDTQKSHWLSSVGLDWRGERLVSLFCYEPPALADWLQAVSDLARPTTVLVTPGRAAAAVQVTGVTETANLHLHFLPAMSQSDFDHLLWSCDLNFVRGEDSLVRAVWAEKPFVWQIYPQEDSAHHAKLEAFLDTMAAPKSMRHFYRAWNGIERTEQGKQTLNAVDDTQLQEWQQTITAACLRLRSQDDLSTQLIRFVQKNR